VALELDPDRRFTDKYLTQDAGRFDHNPKMRAIREMIELTAGTSATVLIRGESGVGKELVARAIHAASPRHERPWIKVNCAALPGDLLESELFGHEKGAFTGAYRRKLGTFEYANGGTLFLDEIGELPLLLQAKLLHVLQDFTFSRVGGHEVYSVDVRVVAATNRNLEAILPTGGFREDLYYRLAVLELYIPPLRDRRDEILSLADHFLERFNAEYRRQVKLPAELAAVLEEYHWPGNIRELENVIRRLVVLANAPSVAAELLRRLGAMAGTRPAHVAGRPASAEELGLKEIARRAAMAAECAAIQDVLTQVRWNRKQAARRLGVSYKTILTKIAACGLTEPQGAAAR
jgi:two-component system, NtrC family, response regulator AtoC